MADEVRMGRRGFGSTAVAGLGSAVVAAIAGNQAWVRIDADNSQVADRSFAQVSSITGDASAPPVTAMALVLLASWGVVLVTRGRFRRAVAWLGLLAAVGVLGFAVAAWIVAPDTVTRDLPSLDVEVSHTAWSYLGVVAGAVGLAMALLAVRSVRRWPEMGQRYDAPADAAARLPVPPEEQSSIDLWKALDEGRDPTEPRER